MKFLYILHKVWMDLLENEKLFENLVDLREKLR
jgi:hypothetical protein